MKRYILLQMATICAISFLLCCCSKNNDTVKIDEFKDLKDSASFALGYLNGEMASKDQNTPINADLYARGFKQAFNGDTNKIWDAQTMQNIVLQYARMTQQKAQQKTFEQEQPDLDRATAFLSDNAQKKDVKTSPSGLQYKVIEQGKGEKPRIGTGDRVIMDYTVYELNSNNNLEQVRNSGKKPGPTGVDNLCEGVREGLSMMNKGSHYLLWFHPELGYGNNPRLQMYDITVKEVLAE